MKNIEVSTLVNHNTFFAAFTLLTIILASGGLSSALAQGSGDRVIDQAQRAVRERIISREGGRNPAVAFNSDAKTEFIWNRGVRVRGTGAFSRNNDPRYNYGESRTFSYEAIPLNGPLDGLPPIVIRWLSNITKTSRRQSICRVRLSPRE